MPRKTRTLIAHQYTIGRDPRWDFDAREAELYWLGDDRYRLEIRRFTHRSHIDMDEAVAIEWLTDAINGDPNVTVAYDRSQRTIVDQLPVGSKLAEMIRPLDEGRLDRDRDEYDEWHFGERRDGTLLEAEDEV